MICWAEKRSLQLLAVAVLAQSGAAVADSNVASSIVSPNAVASADTGSSPAPTVAATSPAAPAGTDSGGPSGAASAAGPAGSGGASAAADALKQKSTDASSEKNLQDVFKAAQNTYSLLKAGGADVIFTETYSYFRDTQINVALSPNGSSITEFQLLNNASNTFLSDLAVDYGVWDNLTATFDLPVVAKFDSLSGLKVTDLGDVSTGFRWQPFPVRVGLPSITVFGTLSTASGSSPYRIDPNNNLSTGKGYYSFSGGASVSKVIDPVVLFASCNLSYGIPISGIEQIRGSRKLTRVDPGDGFGLSMGMAYSLNYDVSISGSVQVSTGLPTKFSFSDGSVLNSANDVTSTMNMGLSLRTSPKRIVNLTFGLGLTPDSPNLILGFNMPLDIEGFTTSANPGQ